MAHNSFQLFLSQIQNAPEELKLVVLRVVFDLLIMYDGDFLGQSEEAVSTFNQLHLVI
jgi:condensin complex subunit 3